MIDNQKYTLYGINEIDNKISNDLKLIVDNVVRLLGKENIHSIILTGSFGKGEGGAFLHDGKVKVINDYDISIIHYGGSFFKLKNINKIKALSEEIAFKINIKQIDLGLIPISKINGSHLTIGHFDFVHGHHILYGKNPFLGSDLNFKSEDIPLFEGSWLLRNRGIGLVLAGLYFIGKKGNNSINKENLWIEINKANLAIGDSSLILKQQYHWSCVERLNRISKFSDSQYYKNALISKLEHNTHPYDMSYEELINDWFKVKEAFLVHFLKYENNRLNSNFLNWNEYIDNIQKNSINRNLKYWYYIFSSEFKSIKDKILSSKIKYEKNMSIGLTSLFLDSIIARNSVDELKISKLKKYFKLKNDINNNIQDWSYMSRFFLLSIHPEEKPRE